jgi:hypothetical protein
MYLFFVRAFNDIDHITPIVWKMKQDDYPVAVYCLDPEYDIENDYRLNFLRNNGVEVEYLYHSFGQKLGITHRILRYLMFKSYAFQKRLDVVDGRRNTLFIGKLRHLARRTGWRLYKLARYLFYNADWARDILDQTGARALCFDWIRPRQFVVDSLVCAAKEKEIPTFALPHGVYLYTNEFITIESRPLETFEKLNQYDHVIVQNELYKEHMTRNGLEKDKIRVMGSARYCSAWMEQNKKILPRTISLPRQADEKLNVVFMPTKVRYRVHTSRMLQTIELLSQLKGINAVVKPHTRTTKEANLFYDIPIPNMSASSSVELCEWADVVLVIGSSIIIEPLLQGKPCLCLKYLHENTTLAEEFNAGWIITDEQQLQEALLRLVVDKKGVPYQQVDVKRFLNDIIYDGQAQRDVLKDYECFIVNPDSQIGN